MPLLLLALLVLLAAGCSLGRPEPPDMPPFAGTEAFLEEQDRVHRATETDEAFRDKYNLGDPEALQRRARVFLMRRREQAERARQMEQDLERARERSEQHRAEEGRRHFAELAAANRYREDLRREREKAAEGKRRFAEIARANRNRQDQGHAAERAEEGKRRFAQAEFLSGYQKREELKRSQEQADQGRTVFTDVQGRRS
jgi:hypothetical protein